ncbi:MAG: hypothetical protein GX419_12045 [Bacteroidales bacterium]|nr:hypothetical protein [Bacteroidales bacterium]
MSVFFGDAYHRLSQVCFASLCLFSFFDLLRWDLAALRKKKARDFRHWLYRL